MRLTIIAVFVCMVVITTLYGHDHRPWLVENNVKDMEDRREDKTDMEDRREDKTDMEDRREDKTDKHETDQLSFNVYLPDRTEKESTLINDQLHHHTKRDLTSVSGHLEDGIERKSASMNGHRHDRPKTRSTLENGHLQDDEIKSAHNKEHLRNNQTKKSAPENDHLENDEPKSTHNKNHLRNNQMTKSAPENGHLENDETKSTHNKNHLQNNQTKKSAPENGHLENDETESTHNKDHLQNNQMTKSAPENGHLENDVTESRHNKDHVGNNQTAKSTGENSHPQNGETESTHDHVQNNETTTSAPGNSHLPDNVMTESASATANIDDGTEGEAEPAGKEDKDDTVTTLSATQREGRLRLTATAVMGTWRLLTSADVKDWTASRTKTAASSTTPDDINAIITPSLRLRLHSCANGHSIHGIGSNVQHAQHVPADQSGDSITDTQSDSARTQAGTNATSTSAERSVSIGKTERPEPVTKSKRSVPIAKHTLAKDTTLHYGRQSSSLPLVATQNGSFLSTDNMRQNTRTERAAEPGYVTDRLTIRRRRESTAGRPAVSMSTQSPAIRESEAGRSVIDMTTKGPANRQNITDKLPVNKTRGQDDITDKLPVNKTRGQDDITDKLPVNKTREQDDITDKLPVNKTREQDDITDKLPVNKTRGQDDITDKLPVNKTRGQNDITDKLPVNKTREQDDITDKTSCQQDQGQDNITDKLPVNKVREQDDITDKLPVNKVRGQDDITDKLPVNKVREQDDITDKLPVNKTRGQDDITDKLPVNKVRGQDDITDKLPVKKTRGPDVTDKLPVKNIRRHDDITDKLPVNKTRGQDDIIDKLPINHTDHSSSSQTLTTATRLCNEPDAQITETNASCLPIIFDVKMMLKVNFTGSRGNGFKSLVEEGDLDNVTSHVTHVMQMRRAHSTCGSGSNVVQKRPVSEPHQWVQLLSFFCHVDTDPSIRLDTMLAAVSYTLNDTYNKVVELLANPAVLHVIACVIPHRDDVTASNISTAALYCNENSISIQTTGATRSHKTLSVQVYVTIVCCVMSELGLLARVALHWVIPFYNTFPGRIQLCLCLSLALAYIFFLLGGIVESGSGACVAVGMITHLTFLCSLFWMNITAYEIWKTFRDWRCQIIPQGNAALFRRGVYAVGIPLVVVGVAVGMDHLDPDHLLSPGYGVPNCWLNKPYAIVTFFVLPCTVLCLINTFLMAFTVRSLRHQRQNMAEFKKNGRVVSVNDVAISFKMLLLVGITWLLGLLAALLDSAVMWIVFTIVNGSLGFVVAVVLLCNRRVLTALWRLCRPSSTDTTSTAPVFTQTQTVSHRC